MTVHSKHAFLPKFDNKKYLPIPEEDELMLMLGKYAGHLFGVTALPKTRPVDGLKVPEMIQPVSKQATDSEYTQGGMEILETMLGLAGKTLLEIAQFLYEHQISVWFEAVSPRLFGDHGFAASGPDKNGARPTCAFLVLTFVEDGNLQFAGLANMYRISTQFGLPMPEGCLADRKTTQKINAKQTPQFNATALAEDVSRELFQIEGATHLSGIVAQRAFGATCEGTVVHVLKHADGSFDEFQEVLSENSTAMQALLTDQWYEALEKLATVHKERSFQPKVEVSDDFSVDKKMLTSSEAFELMKPAGGDLEALAEVLEQYPDAHFHIRSGEFERGGVKYQLVIFSASRDAMYYTTNVRHEFTGTPVLPRTLCFCIAEADAVLPAKSLPEEHVEIVTTVKRKLLMYIVGTMVLRNHAKRIVASEKTLLDRLAKVCFEFNADRKAVPARMVQMLEDAEAVLRDAYDKDAFDQYFDFEHYLDFVAKLPDHVKALEAGRPTRAISVLDLVTPKKQEPGAAVRSIEEHYLDRGYVTKNGRKFGAEPGQYTVSTSPPKSHSGCLVTVIAVPEGRPPNKKMIDRISEPKLTVVVKDADAPVDGISAILEEWMAALPPLSAPKAIETEGAQEHADEVAVERKITVTVVSFVGICPGSGKTELALKLVKHNPAIKLYHSDVIGTKLFYLEVGKEVVAFQEDTIIIVDRNYPDSNGVSAEINWLTRLKKQTPWIKFELVLIRPTYIDVEENKRRILARKEGEHGLLATVPGWETILVECFFLKSNAIRAAMIEAKFPIVEHDFYAPEDPERTKALANGLREYAVPISSVETMLNEMMSSPKRQLKIQFMSGGHISLDSPGVKPSEEAMGLLGQAVPIKLTGYQVAELGKNRVGYWTVDDASIPARLQRPDRLGLYHVTDDAMLTDGLRPVEAFNALKGLSGAEPGLAGLSWKLVKAEDYAGKDLPALFGRVVYE